MLNIPYSYTPKRRQTASVIYSTSVRDKAQDLMRGEIGSGNSNHKGTKRIKTKSRTFEYVFEFKHIWTSGSRVS